ncbi:MAG TPA: DUF4240 domain-containing protein [Gemmataceae bacterium]
MTKDRFWEIIEASRVAFDPKDIEASQRQQVGRLRELLEALPAEEVRSYAEHFAEHMDEAYSEPNRIVDMEPMDGLWAVAFNMGGGCGHDSFDDFRSWLISMGRAAYEAALRDPETVYHLVEPAGDLADVVFFEEFQYIPWQVLREKTGEDD